MPCGGHLARGRERRAVEQVGQLWRRLAVGEEGLGWRMDSKVLLSSSRKSPGHVRPRVTAHQLGDFVDMARRMASDTFESTRGRGRG